MEQLIQKRGGDFRRYHFGYDGLKISTYTMETYQTYTYKYEDIEFTEIVTIQKPAIHRIILFFSVLLNFLLLLFLAAPYIVALSGSKYVLWIPVIAATVAMSMWAFLIFRKKFEKMLTGPINVVFYYDRNDRRIVDEFVESLKNKQRDFLRKKYMRIDQYIPVDQQQQRFSWMYDRDFITRSELEILMEETDILRMSKGNKI
jgi:hypothetical protein